jgi:hypothetical protein
MTAWLGLCSSARRGAAGGASGLARKIPPRWTALRRLPPTASASWTLSSSTAAGQKQVLQLAVGWFREPLATAGLGAVRFKVVVRDHLEAEVDAHHQDMREARNCFDEGGVRILFSVTDAAARPMVFSRQQPPAQPGSPPQLQELFRSHADLCWAVCWASFGPLQAGLPQSLPRGALPRLPAWEPARLLCGRRTSTQHRASSTGSPK